MNLMRSLFPHLKGIPFNGYYNEQPVMLIGTTHAAIIENIGKLRSGSFDEPIGIETVLGFSVFGGNPDIQYLDTTTVAQTNIEDATFTQELFEAQGKITNEDLYVLLKRFNAVESIGIKAAGHYIIEEERKAIEILQEELCILDDGTVEVPLVWNRDKDKKIPKLPNNYSVALKRQLALEKKLAKTPDYWQGYKKNVKELLELNYDLTNVWPNTCNLAMGCYRLCE
ncbi:hypothetical protein PVAND_002467 [Polypedilum vanderplanki]|uniref:Uncharacterized protein n=1 Tax=Polypedilum vanderplanki TaxID=319348 RepID=A0A9J6BRR2_POLVA|nr:hypothetical protein PVAND_002467 [Polypedilum vanderplanki]